MSGSGLDRLAHLAATILEAEQARLRAASRRRIDAEAKIADLDSAVARQHAVISAEIEAPVAGLVLDRWGGWADRLRMVLNAELARERAAWEEQRRATLKAFGRAEALRRLEAEAADKARLLARRRQTRK